MYELFILSLLMHFPLHAYLITKIISPWENISKGTLSTLLTKLEKEGFISEADSGSVPFPTDRPSRTFAITTKGRERFFHLMMDTTSNPGTYQRIFHIKSGHLEFLSAEDQHYLVNHFLQYCRNSIQNFVVQIKKFEDNPEPTENIPSMQFYETTHDLIKVRLEQIQLEVAWAQRLREQIVLGMNNKDR